MSEKPRIVQSVIRAERKNGIIRQKNVPNSNLTFEVEDFCANSIIKEDTEGIIVLFSNGEKQDGIFIPLSQQKSLIELTKAVADISFSEVVIPNPLDPNILFLEDVFLQLTALSAKAKLILRKIV